MSTKTFTLNGTTTYTNAFGVSEAPAILSPTTYQTINSGQLDVPAGTTAGTSYTIPMGPITVVRALRMLNGSGQELNVKYNGATASYGIPSSGVEIKVFPSDASTPITSIALVATEATSAADGVIDYAVCGT